VTFQPSHGALGEQPLVGLPTDVVKDYLMLRQRLLTFSSGILVDAYDVIL